jgi:CubicO group peptidase (beta-lactamase class C family)
LGFRISYPSLIPEPGPAVTIPRATLHSRSLFPLLCLLGVAAAAGTAPASAQTTWPGPEWATSTPEAEGVDPEAVTSLVADIDAGIYGLVDHFLLIRHGRVIADHHFPHDYDSISAQYDPVDYQYDYDAPSWHPYYQGTELHSLQSVTKSVTSAALGIAMDRGLIESVDVPAMSFFGDYTFDLSDARKQAITFEDFLTMRSGIAWAIPGQSYDDDSHPTIQLENSDDWIQFVLDQPMGEEPGVRFDYNDGVSVLIGKIVREATGRRIDEWTEELIFRPIGIDEYYWKTTPLGEVDTEGGLYLTTHDLARFGYLFLRGGEWDGRQIISREWVEASTAPVIPDIAPNNNRRDSGYGYQWWVPQHGPDLPTIFAGNGYGGQFVMVAPDYDIVVVFNGWGIHGGAQRSTWRALQERILPAMREK